MNFLHPYTMLFRAAKYRSVRYVSTNTRPCVLQSRGEKEAKKGRISSENRPISPQNLITASAPLFWQENLSLRRSRKERLICRSRKTVILPPFHLSKNGSSAQPSLCCFPKARLRNGNRTSCRNATRRRKARQDRYRSERRNPRKARQTSS